ncbi:MAG TPA: dihydrolipoamide acetyltransferase family protein [Gaiellaceae bacterium]|jgi:pyruvate dehydrogenase E2 component (dihydrolipoamide acetyltransferase)|nr:dihydrolipoamide acetyltransferase family protein [Gaiellaceae bacterium]
MPTDVIMPALGMAQETGKIVRWLKAEGDTVAKGEPLMEVETDKVTVDVEAPADGRLAAVAAGEGEDVPVGQTIALILATGEEAPAGGEAGPSNAESQRRDGAAETRGRRRPLASPKARRLAAERNIDLAALSGSGPRGAVLAADVDESATQSHKATSELGTVWRRMAERTTASWQSVPHFFLERAIDVTRLNAWRETARRREGYDRVSHTDLLVKLAAAALARHPRVNARWQEGTIVPSERIHVGIAVAIDDGLIVPVVHDADRLSLKDVSARRVQLVEAARAGRLRPDDVSGGTFTISNLGMYGVDSFQAIVNAPQAAILAVGRIVDRVIPVDGAPAVRPAMTLTLSFDHRVVDGARGAEFLDTLAALAEEPAGLVD